VISSEVWSGLVVLGHGWGERLVDVLEVWTTGIYLHACGPEIWVGI